VGVAVGRFLLVAFLACGCGASAQNPASGDKGAGGDEARPGDPVVTLIGPGEEPRSPLRYRPVAGQRSTMFIDMAMTMTMGIADTPPKTISTPPLRMALSFEVLHVDPSGTARIKSNVERVEVLARPSDPPELVQSIRSEMSPMVGLKTEASVTNRGFTRDAKADIPKNLSPKLRATVEGAQTMTQQVAAAFPVEPVGLGAHWRVDSKVTDGMMAFEQTTLVTLVEKTSDRVVLSLTIDQVAPRQPLKVPDAPPGAKTTLERYQGHGNGRSDLPLDATTPIAEMTVRSSLLTEVVVEDERVTVTNDTETVMKFSPTEPR
jgi:hypothetical protein